jgi:hypothetical protein
MSSRSARHQPSAARPRPSAARPLASSVRRMPFARSSRHRPSAPRPWPGAPWPSSIPPSSWGVRASPTARHAPGCRSSRRPRGRHRPAVEPKVEQTGQCRARQRLAQARHTPSLPAPAMRPSGPFAHGCRAPSASIVRPMRPSPPAAAVRRPLRSPALAQAGSSSCGPKPSAARPGPESAKRLDRQAHAPQSRQRLAHCPPRVRPPSNPASRAKAFSASPTTGRRATGYRAKGDSGSPTARQAPSGSFALGHAPKADSAPPKARHATGCRATGYRAKALRVCPRTSCGIA